MLLGTLVVAAVLLTGLTAASAELYEQVDQGEGVAMLDRPVLDVALAVRSEPVDQAVTLYTHLGGPIGMPVLATVATLALAPSRRRWSPIVLMLAATAGSLAMTFAGKTVIGRTRPPLLDAVPPYQSSASFPGGHALNAVVVAHRLYLTAHRRGISRRQSADRAT